MVVTITSLRLRSRWGFFRLWESEKDAKAFALSGAHREAMKAGSYLATEIRIHTYEAGGLPAWNEAKALVGKHGRKFSHR